MQNEKFILVTGGAGYIGSHTVVELYSNGYTPIILDDFRNSSKRVIEGIEKIIGEQVQFHEIDICDPAQLEQIFRNYKIDGVIHFAAYKAVGESVLEPLKYYKNNIIGLLNVLELSTKYNVRPFVFSSSCTVYGEPKGLKEVKESTPLSKPSSPYGNTKLIGEQILNDFFVSQPTAKILNLRYFNPIGAHPSSLIGELPNGKPNNLLPYITQTAIGKLKELVVHGNDYPTKDGSCVRDYIHVCDLAKAHVKALNYLENETQGLIDAVNVGTGQGKTVIEVIETFESITGEKINWRFGPRRSGDVDEIYANSAKSKELLNWEANHSFEDAILHAWLWENKLRKNDE
jgi:UDP-glucose 4-epimerase